MSDKKSKTFLNFYYFIIVSMMKQMKFKLLIPVWEKSEEDTLLVRLHIGHTRLTHGIPAKIQRCTLMHPLQSELLYNRY